MLYNWQLADWPNFSYEQPDLENKLYLFFEKAGMITGMVKALPDDVRLDAIVETMVIEAIKTSEIEGEFLDRADVRSSIKNALGLNTYLEHVKDKKADGVAQLMIDVRQTYAAPLTAEKLFAWHKLLLNHEQGIKIGGWRDHEEPMQIVSGAMGKPVVHFEAPPSRHVEKEMTLFLDWFNKTAPGEPNGIKSAPLRSAIAHLYFESIHPFEDGNGRIGRAIAEKALSQGIGRPALLSLSRTIELSKNAYYKALQLAQLSMEITPWINYFVEVVLDAQQYAEEQIDFTLTKTLFFDKFNKDLNDRQLKVVRRILEEGHKGFEGGLNASKYGSLTKTSKATATRDLQDMLVKGVIIPLGDGGGRSVKYQLNLEARQEKKSARPTLAQEIKEALKAIDSPEEVNSAISPNQNALNTQRIRKR